MTTPSPFADRTISAARELRRWGGDVRAAFAIKIVAILALALALFGAGHRHSVDSARVSAPVQSAARLTG